MFLALEFLNRSCGIVCRPWLSCDTGSLLAWYPKYKQWKRVQDLLEQAGPPDESKFGLWPVKKILGEAGTLSHVCK